MTRRPLPLLTFAAFVAMAPAALGQVLQLTVSANGTANAIPAGGSQTLTANGIGQAVQATVVVRYTGTSVATISAITVANTAEITLQSAPALPFTLTPGAANTFLVQYLPASGNLVTSLVSITYTETGQAANTFSFSVSGISPRYTYTLSVNNGNFAALNGGDTIPFGSVNLGSTIPAVVNISNSGSSGGTLNSVGVSGSGFQLSANPSPVYLQPGQQASVGLNYAPQVSGGSQGLLTVAFGSSTVSFPLTGTGTAAVLSASYTLADGNVHALTSGSTIAFPSIDINASTGATVTITNQGNGAGTLTSVSVSGAPFQLNGLPSLPATIAAGTVLRFAIVFSPTQSGSFNGTFGISMTGVSISGSLSGSTAPSNITLSYIDPDTNNVIPLQNGSTLQFPNTLSGSNTSVTVVATNSGAGTGSVGAVSIGGSSASAFQLLNLPGLPVSVAPNQQTRFGIRFSPTQQQSYAATLSVTINGQITTVNLAAQGIAPQFTYTATSGSSTTAVAAGGTIAVSDTTVGQTTSVTVTITNAGSGNGQIAAIGVTGQGLSLSNLPPLPLTLAPNGTQQFTLNFTPTTPGAVSGKLTIGSDTFTVSGTGIGSQLTYNYTSSAGSTTITAGGTVIFAPIAVGSSETLAFTIQNTGTSQATISSIGLATASTVFGLQQLPSLPFNLSPNGTANFTISFLPNNTGTLTAILVVNGTNFTISGTGTQPAALPTYQFQGVNSSVQPAQQPAIGLTMSSSYPLDLQGSLTISFASAVFTDDPSIEFANGSRTVSFTIPAHSTQAVFTGGATSIPLQTGTTAGTITVTPSFSLQGGFNLTPTSPAVLSLAIPRAAPQLTSASITGESLTGFSLILSGYSTPRTLTQFNIQITPKAGATFSTTNLTVDVTTAASAWFQSATSQGFGGSFLVAIPFTLQNGSTTTDLVHLLQSLSITATNDVGASSSLSVAIP